MCHYMKTLITTIAILTLALSATAQRRISYGYTEIKKMQFDSCSRTSYLIENTQIKKQSGKLTIPVSGKPAKIFNDDNSDENFQEFQYLGDIYGTKFSLIKQTDYNTKSIILLIVRQELLTH